MALNWTPVHTIQGEAGIMVSVSRTDEKRPRYSLTLGKVIEDSEKINRFLPIYIDGIKIRSVVPEVSRLLDEAESWINDDAIALRMEREMEVANRGKPVTRVTGKTEKNKNKGKDKSEATDG